VATLTPESESRPGGLPSWWHWPRTPVQFALSVALAQMANAAMYTIVT